MSATSNTESGSTSDSLKAAIFQRLHPRVYLERFLAEGVRPDGRALGCVVDKAEEKEIWRDVSINVGMSFRFSFFVLPWNCSLAFSFSNV